MDTSKSNGKQLTEGSNNNQETFCQKPGRQDVSQENEEYRKGRKGPVVSENNRDCSEGTSVGAAVAENNGLHENDFEIRILPEVEDAHASVLYSVNASEKQEHFRSTKDSTVDTNMESEESADTDIYLSFEHGQPVYENIRNVVYPKQSIGQWDRNKVQSETDVAHSDAKMSSEIPGQYEHQVEDSDQPNLIVENDYMVIPPDCCNQAVSLDFVREVLYKPTSRAHTEKHNWQRDRSGSESENEKDSNGSVLSDVKRDGDEDEGTEHCLDESDGQDEVQLLPQMQVCQSYREDVSMNFVREVLFEPVSLQTETDSWKNSEDKYQSKIEEEGENELCVKHDDVDTGEDLERLLNNEVLQQSDNFDQLDDSDVDIVPETVSPLRGLFPNCSRGKANGNKGHRRHKNSDKSKTQGPGSQKVKFDIAMNELKDKADRSRRNQNRSWIDQRSLSVEMKFKDVLQELKDGKMELDEETKWIRRHFKRRDCSKFLLAQNQTTEDYDLMKCQCNYAYKDHSKEAKRLRRDGEEQKWNYKSHSKQSMTNAFGEMEFVGYGGNVGKYIRVDVDTKVNEMLDLMIKVWGLDKPNLLISVTGGAKNFQMNKRLRDTFRRGLMKTALTTGAWIITGGTHAGVMKHVGEAVKDFGIASTSKNPVIAIGVAPWGCIQNKDVLINDECTGLYPANYRIEREQRPKESFLDPNHSHFVLVDNATVHKFAVEIPFRAKLEKEISKIRTDTGDNAVSVPTVLLVLEGGPGTLETVHQAIENNTPTVVVKGSGRAADILAYAYQNAREEEIEAIDQDGNCQKRQGRVLDDSVYVQVLEMIEKEFGRSETAIHMGRIKDCLRKSDFLSVFEMETKGGVKEIDIAMLQALLKANKNQVMDQLRLALAWNRIDVAKSDIFTDDKRWPTGSLDDVMFSAIQLNRVDFIELFLDHGVSLREFLTKKRLLLLYNKLPQNCLLGTLLEKIRAKDDVHRKNFSLSDVGQLIQELMGDTFRTVYTTKQAYALLDVDYIIDGLTTKKARAGGISGIKAITQVVINPVDTTDGRRNRTNDRVTQDFENPCQDLFIWSVLMIRQRMAKLFWAEGKDAIAAALVGNSLLKAMKDKTEDTELAIHIQTNMDEWSDLAVGVLSECHSTDERKAQDLLVRELTNWGDTTCMLIAVKADNKDFISQTACQSLLNSIWMGRMAQDNDTWRLLVCLIFPPMVIALLKFVPNKEEEGILVTQAEDTNKEDPSKRKMRRQMTFSREKTVMPGLRNSQASLRAEEEKEESSPVVVKKTKKIGEKLYYFFNAPVIIFLYNVLSYLVFLGLFTYVLIFNFNPNVSMSEIVLMIWVFTIFTEEIRQVATTTSNSLITKLQSYIMDTWNVVDMITIALFIIGMVLRFLPYENTFEAARVFLALNFVSFFLRLLHIFSVHKELGPKLVMIGRMVQDLLYFLVILMVFVFSYAIASHSILFPNSPFSWYTAIAVIRKSYWNIYGELFLEELEGADDCTFDEVLWSNNTHPRCPTEVGKIVVPIMMGIYMLLANVLLLNLLIAMFSYTFSSIQDNTDKHWFYQRYSLIYEYYTRPVLCPPLIFFAHLYLFGKFIVTTCCCCCIKPTVPNIDDDFRRKFKNERELVQWENVIADAFHQKKELEDFQSMDYKVDVTHTTIKDLMNRIDEIQDQQQQQQIGVVMAAPTQPAQPAPPPAASPSRVVATITPQLDDRLSTLEKRLNDTQKSLEWIITAMQESMKSKQSDASSTVILPPTIQSLEQQKEEGSKKKKKSSRRQKQLREEEENRIIRELMQEGQELHFRSRMSPYLGSVILRFPVPDEKVSWQSEYAEYSPSIYTAQTVLSNPPWADPDLVPMRPSDRVKTIGSFNQMDNFYNCSRVSYLGQYEVVDGLPRNPKGRTGLNGRGLLGRWGPNHAGDPIVTRWKMMGDQRVMKEGKPVLEFVAVLRSDNQQWALPGGILKPGGSPAENLKAEFTQEALNSIQGTKDEKSVQKKLQKLWKKGEKLYEGYADDPRNTDNAWLETCVFHYHDDEGTILRNFDLRAGESVELASWLAVSHMVTLHGSHLFFVRLAAEKLGAYF